MRAGLGSKALNALSNHGNVVIALKHDNDVTTDALSPRKFMGRHSTFIPRLRKKLTRLHTLFSLNSKLPKEAAPQIHAEEQKKPKRRAYSMTRLQRFKRFAVDKEKGEKYARRARIIASIEAPLAAQKILRHLRSDQSEVSQNRSTAYAPERSINEAIQSLDFSGKSLNFGCSAHPVSG